MLLPPIAAPATIDGAPNPNGFSYSGGSDGVYASNINKTYDEKSYFATYFQDDWKMTPKPVSYTHLDVYKRQTLPRTLMKPFTKSG